MRPHFLATSLLLGFLIFETPAVSSPQDCTPSIVAMIRLYLIEASGFEDAFRFLDAGDCVAALNQFEEAAKRGNLAAQNNIGVIYESGLGVHVDLERARQWYRKAAERGLPDAQWNLAAIILSPYPNVNLLEAFLPIPQPETPQETARYREALMWSIAAAENGHPIAREGVRRLSDALEETDVRIARSWARKWMGPKVIVPSASNAGAYSKIDKARTVAELARVRNQVEATMPSLITMSLDLMQRSFETANPDVGSDERWQTYFSRLRYIMEEGAVLHIDKFVEQMALVYADAFLEEELDALIEMVRDPVMQKMLDRTPELMRAGQEAGEEWGRGVAEIAIQRLMDEYNLTLDSE
jgi:hypothetical protein